MAIWHSCFPKDLLRNLAAFRAQNNPCQIANSIREKTVIIAVTVPNINGEKPFIQDCVYNPGELYNMTDSNLQINTLESLSYGNI